MLVYYPIKSGAGAPQNVKFGCAAANAVDDKSKNRNVLNSSLQWTNQMYNFQCNANV